MATPTATYSFNLPEVGADNDLWGGFLNANWTQLDGLLSGAEPLVAVDIDGGTINGTAIGPAVPSTGAFTGLIADNVTINTTLTASSTNITGSFTFVNCTSSGSATFNVMFIDGVATFTASPIVPDGATGTEAINADDVDAKIAAIPDPETPTFFEESHDPTGVASYRIVGTTLECWGTANLGSNTQTIPLPKTYNNNVFSARVSKGNGDVDCGVDSKTTTSFDIVSKGTGPHDWHTVGQWNGV